MCRWSCSGCSSVRKKSIEAQLARGHKGKGDQRKKIKHSPSGSDLSQDEVENKLGSFGSSGRKLEVPYK